jgi:hypothetical protein
MRVTFAVATLLIVVALAIAVGSRAVATHPRCRPSGSVALSDGA